MMLEKAGDKKDDKKDDIKWHGKTTKETEEERKKRMAAVYDEAMKIEAAHSHATPLHVNTIQL